MKLFAASMGVSNLSVYILCILLNIRVTDSAGTITFTSEDDSTFQAEVKDADALSYNIRNGWKIVLTFSDPVINIRSVSLHCSLFILEVQSSCVLLDMKKLFHS